MENIGDRFHGADLRMDKLCEIMIEQERVMNQQALVIKQQRREIDHLNTSVSNLWETVTASMETARGASKITAEAIKNIHVRIDDVRQSVS
jgi:uncharacterized coiled-coil protein SlyX